MNIERVLQARANKAGRNGRPFVVFNDSFTEIARACNAIKSGEVEKFASLVERAALISLVTSIEVYYRDMLDAVFRHCSKEFFKPLLKTLLKDKYSIDDLIVFYEQSIHPLELVSANQNFQNIESIEFVFSKIIGCPFWKSLFELQVRIAPYPDKIYHFQPSLLDALKRVFSVRHQLVHNPSNSESLIDSSLLKDMYDVSGLIVGSDILITKAIDANLDPALRITQEQAQQDAAANP